MSQHSSLKASKTKKHRTVLKRYERFFTLKEKDILKDGDSVFGMPKLKIVRVKIKKEKVEKPEEAGAVTEAAQVPAGTAPKETAAKPAAAKSAAVKPAKEEKKQKK